MPPPDTTIDSGPTEPSQRARPPSPSPAHRLRTQQRSSAGSTPNPSPTVRRPRPSPVFQTAPTPPPSGRRRRRKPGCDTGDQNLHGRYHRLPGKDRQGPGHRPGQGQEQKSRHLQGQDLQLRQRLGQRRQAAGKRPGRQGQEGGRQDPGRQVEDVGAYGSRRRGPAGSGSPLGPFLPTPAAGSPGRRSSSGDRLTGRHA